MKKRQRLILVALQALGGKATTKEISKKTGLHANGVSQSLGALGAKGHVAGLGGKSSDFVWKLLAKEF